MTRSSVERVFFVSYYCSAMSPATAIKYENLRRVSVVGTSCSGKTTFAKNLASILGSKHIELDAIYWLPDWIERPQDEFLDLVKNETLAERWVCDGNYTRVREAIWERTTAIVWLDYSFPRTVYRAMNRTTRRIISGERIFSGNRETFKMAFMSRDSILLWVLTTYFERRRRYAELLRKENSREKGIFIFRHPKEAEKFLRQVEQADS